MRHWLNKIINSNVLIISLIFVIILELAVFFKIDNQFHLFFFDIGQGDSIFIKTAGSHYILIDGGEGEKVLEELGTVLPYWDKKIDLVIGTHADSDHIGGLVFVLEKYEVDTFLTSDLEVEDNNMKKIKDVAARKGITLAELDAGDTIDIGELHFDVLWPDEYFSADNDNQNSVVLKGLYMGFSFLLTGDIEMEQEQLITARYSSIASDVLKVSHHGSKTATSEEILREVYPLYAVISCGKDNKFGHPSADVIDKLMDFNIPILRTDLSGTIEFIIDDYGKVVLK